MTNYAQIENNIAVTVSNNPSAIFTAQQAEQFVEVPDEVEPGWRHDADTKSWSAPPPVDPQDPPVAPTEHYRTRVTRAEFKLLFPRDTRVKIRKARDYRGADEAALEIKYNLDDLMELIEDDSLAALHTDHPQIQDGLTYLVAIGFMSADEKAIISKGVAE